MSSRAFKLKFPGGSSIAATSADAGTARGFGGGMFLDACRRKSRRGIKLKTKRSVQHGAAGRLNLVTELARPDDVVETAAGAMSMHLWLNQELRRLTAKGQHVALINVGNRIAIHRTR